MKRNTNMLPAAEDNNSRDLMGEIFQVLHLLPELHRNIFTEARYRGQSPETLSLALKMDVGDVNEILRRCDLQMYAALRKFRADSCLKASGKPAATARFDASGRHWGKRTFPVLHPCHNF